ncbi:unnamed protein product [Thlaspi arvense]|uniref:E3 ubiquitin-protein ligase RMA n=1 Tax=Thlaspi arvense TaxID=13288 RepID=A0AAU9S2A5_THLAR|nr:unnamed protein product [Thlaspi arvense]
MKDSIVPKEGPKLADEFSTVSSPGAYRQPNWLSISFCLAPFRSRDCSFYRSRVLSPSVTRIIYLNPLSSLRISSKTEKLTNAVPGKFFCVISPSLLFLTGIGITKIQRSFNFVYLMGEEISSTVNLDLNLGPDPEISLEPATNDAAVDLANWAIEPFNRESESLRRFRTRHRSRFRQISLLPALSETHSPAIELSQLMISPANAAALPAGEGSLAGGERVSEEDSKKCENGNKAMEEDNVTEEKKVIEKSVGSDGSFFDCYICLDLSKDPVVTNCGHLYCWSCLYRWLQVSEAKECPVCKGEVTVKTLTPIYGRGKNKRESEEVSDAKIPSRPQARRMESLRTTLHRSGYVPAEMIRHLQDRLERESSTGEIRPRPFLNRFMTSRGVRAEQNQSSGALVEALGEISDMDLMSSIAPENEGENGNPRPSSRERSIRRQLQAQRAARTSFSPVLTSAERLVDAYLITNALGRNPEQSNNPPAVGVEDRDSFSSIAGVMNSESQVDTAAEIDSMLTASTSSSVRRPHENGSRVSDVDSADSRPLRRRRRLA